VVFTMEATTNQRMNQGKIFPNLKPCPWPR
jgi:hypothetical protein